MPIPTQWYSVREAADELGLSTQRVCSLIRDKKLRAKVIPQWGRKRYWVSGRAINERLHEAKQSARLTPSETP